MMHEREKSDPAVVAVKPVNAAERSAAESVEPRAGAEGNVVLVRGLDCLDETPLLDIKPDRCEFTPLAPPQAGDFETE